jgi:hypothetical protein
MPRHHGPLAATPAGRDRRRGAPRWAWSLTLAGIGALIGCRPIPTEKAAAPFVAPAPDERGPSVSCTPHRVVRTQSTDCAVIYSGSGTLTVQGWTFWPESDAIPPIVRDSLTARDTHWGGPMVIGGRVEVRGTLAIGAKTRPVHLWDTVIVDPRR